MAKILWTGKEKIRLQQYLPWLGEAFLLQLLWWSVAWRSPENASAVGRRVMSWLGPRLTKHRHILANIRTAFPQKTPEEHTQIARDIWGGLGCVLAEYVHLGKLIDIDRPDPYVEVVYRYGDGSIMKDDVPRIFFSAHIANWELSSLPMRHFKHKPDTIYGPQNNLLLERMIQRKRNQLNVGFTHKINGTRALYRSMQKGLSTGMMADVRVDRGPSVPFFGNNAPSSPTLAWLSLKTGADIVPVEVERLGDARYRVTVHPGFRTEVKPGETEKQATARVTADIAKIVEGWVRKNPDQWWCNKHRWTRRLMKQLGNY